LGPSLAHALQHAWEIAADKKAGPQTIEGRADGAIDIPGRSQDAALKEDGQGEQHPSVRDLEPGLKEGTGIIQDTQTGQEPVKAPVGWIRIHGGRTRLLEIGLLEG
jgi:hypothetical protein